MPTPASNSTEPGARPVYLIHDLGLGRCFWAYWPNADDIQGHHAPAAYATIESPLAELRTQLEARYPEAQALAMPPDAVRELYRRIRRAELPEEVRQRISATLQSQRRQRRDRFAAAGFLPEELEDLAALKRRYRQLATEHHPDRGGDSEKFKALHALYRQAVRRLKKPPEA